jgi:hypothetical protein
MNHRSLESLDREVEQLPQEIMPPRSLWPAIVADVGGSRRRPSYLMAACVAVAAACLASVFTWVVMRHAIETPGLPAMVRNEQFEEPVDPRYLKARDQLERTFRERMTQLDPSTRAQIEASLMVIREAHEKIRQALVADPSSAVLEDLWQSTMHDEIDLYDHVVQATDNSLTRS